MSLPSSPYLVSHGLCSRPGQVDQPAVLNLAGHQAEVDERIQVLGGERGLQHLG